MELQYGFLPCLQVGSDQRPIYLPMEVANLTSIWYSFTSISSVTDSDSIRISGLQDSSWTAVQEEAGKPTGL
jgi:hypothetical protein